MNQPLTSSAVSLHERRPHAVSAVAVLLSLAWVAGCDDNGDDAPPPAGPAPQVAGPARYLDVDGDGSLGAGDRVLVTFTAPVRLDGAAPSDFVLPVAADTFGRGAIVAPGPSPQEVAIVLGDAPVLTIGGVFAGGASMREPSAIDVANGVGGRIVGQGGRSAIPSAPADLVPQLAAGASLATTGATALAAGDLDRDGDLDLVVARGGAADAIWINDGNGTFADSGQVLTGASTQAVAIGDLNRDGALDVATAGGEGARVWFGAGNGTVALGPTFGSPSARAIALVDLDGDGDLDVAIGTWRGAADEIWRNEGNGTFVDTMQRLPGETFALAAGDVDADGDVDLLAVGEGAARLWLNAGDGSFVAGNAPVANGPSFAAVLRDLDHDGDLDAAIAGEDDAWLHANDGAGTFAVADAREAAASRAIGIGDLDGDGRPDVVAGYGDDAEDRVFLLRNGLVLVDALQRLGGGVTTSLVLADVDGDADADLVAATEDGDVQVWRNPLSVSRAAGMLVGSGSFGSGGTRALASADFDRDGLPDVLEGNAAVASRANAIHVNTGGGSFAVPGRELSTADTRALAVGDLTGDGAPDLVVGGIDGTTRVWHNDGSGGFPAPSQTLVAFPTGALALADLDGDGDLDLVRGGAGGQRTTVWRNDGSGIFVNDGQTIGGSDTTSLATGDIDRDGDVDVLVGDATDGLRVYRNDGSGSFSTSGVSIPGNVAALVLGDLDGDGDPDAVVGFGGGAKDRVLFNDGSGELSDSGQRLGKFDTTALALADVDLDGDLDLVTGHADAADLLWWNDGAGQFSNSQQTLFGGETRALLAIDLDLDGDDDLLVGDGAVPGAVGIWINR